MKKRTLEQKSPMTGGHGSCPPWIRHCQLVVNWSCINSTRLVQLYRVELPNL